MLEPTRTAKGSEVVLVTEYVATFLESLAITLILTQAEDAILVDSSYMTIDEVIEVISTICEKARK